MAGDLAGRVRHHIPGLPQRQLLEVRRQAALGRKRILKAVILAYDFPPLVSVGGLRPYSWLRYFRDSGIEPVVITRQWANRHQNELDYIAASDTDETQVEANEYGTVIRTRYRPNLSNRLLTKYGPARFRLIRKSLTAFYELGQYSFAIGPKRELYRAAFDYLHRSGADVIVATGEPFVLFKYAAELSRKFGIPWVADYRDPWTQDKRRAATRVSASWDARLEKKFARSADAITTVSEFVKSLIEQLVPDKPFFIVPNGYDPEAAADAREIRQDAEKFTIAFAGSLYGWHPLQSFLLACDAFVKRQHQPRFQLKFVGINGQGELEAFLRSSAASLASHVTFVGRVPNREMAQLLARANVLLAFNNYSYLGTKVYDYLALKRTILLCYTDDAEAKRLKQRFYNMDDSASGNPRVLEGLLAETNSGIAVKDAAQLQQLLPALYQTFLQRGEIPCESTGVEKYSREAGAKAMAEVLKACVARHRGKLEEI